jgi:hypothetical protein
MKRTTGLVVVASALALIPAFAAAQDDEVLYWNAVLLRSMQTAGTPGPLAARTAAIVHVAIFDAVNGIEERYEPLYVKDTFPRRGAWARASAVQAAYVTLTSLFPAQAAALEADRQTSLAGIPGAQGNSMSINRGIEWGQQVAEEVMAWRSRDGLSTAPSTYTGSTAVGKWRPTPRPPTTPGGPELDGLNGLVPSMATTTPFVIPSPSYFRSVTGPPALASAQYAADVNEVKSVGEATSTTRTPDQTVAARFWAGTPLAFWHRAAAAASRARRFTLSDNARLFALLSVAAADAVISGWDAKHHFEFWRPITAIRLADTDGNAATSPQPTWTPLLTTPNYSEYDSGHQSGAGSAQYILRRYFGDGTPVEGFSEGLPDVTRSFPSFKAAADEALWSRVWGGIHFRTAMLDTRVRAESIAQYVLANAARRVDASGQRP